MAVITISRQFGAGGRTLSERLGEKLGYAVVNEDIIERAAQEANVSPEWIKAIEEEQKGSFFTYLSKLSPVRRGFIERPLTDTSGYIDGARYVELLNKIIPQIADKGNVIIVGRGGQYILKGRKDAVHLLLVADREHRLKFMKEHYNFSASQASEVIHNMGRRRANLYKYFGRKDYDDMINYHLTFNAAKTSLEKIVDLTALFVTTQNL